MVWEPRRGRLRSNLRLAVGGERLSNVTGPAPRYFGDFWHHAHAPAKLFVLSFLIHVFLVNAPIFGWGRSVPRPPLDAPRIELVWHGSASDLPLLAPPKPKPRPAARVNPAKEEPRRGADAFHPRQTIMASPPRITHPRQLLIQPASALEAPRILPELPNIVQWNKSTGPARPKLNVRAPVLRARARRATAPNADLAAPQIHHAQAVPGEVALAVSEARVARPRLEVTPVRLAERRGRPQAGDAGEPAPPDIGGPAAPEGIAAGSSTLKNIVALSATPAPPEEEFVVPPGNLSARLSISPEGPSPGTPGGTGQSAGAGNGNGTSGKGTGIPDVYVSGGNPANAQPVAGLGGGGNPGGGGNAVAPAPVTPLPARPGPGRPLDLRMAPVRPAPKPGAAKDEAARPTEQVVEEVLGPRPVYTLHVNMPNLSSATGSWVLNFAPLRSATESSASGLRGLLREANPADLTGPVPLRKVDPKYPPALADARVQGEVVLYAIIRKDGSVDSIQLVRGVQPQLDQNAMQALARWQFRPAERNGEPVELEAVVRIPFRPFLP